MNIVHCGDSYTVGVGCVEPTISSYARLVSDHYGSEYLTLARPGASVYVTHLQSLFAADTLSPDLVIFNTTSIDRVEWIADTSTYDGPLTALNVMAWSPREGENYPYFFELWPGYHPIMHSETISFLDYISKISHPKLQYESPKKIETILDYSAMYRDPRIHNHYCDGMILNTYLRLKKKGIPCVFILNDNFIHLADLVEYSIHVDFFKLSEEMPGRTEKMHCSEEAHVMVADMLKAVIDENGLAK